MSVPRLSAAAAASQAALSKGHLPALDGLRGLAILLVLVHNLDIFIPAGHASWGVRLYKEMAFMGWIGVQLFFVLSGFLITRGLLATRDDPHYFRNFYARRVLRIFPLYYLALVIFTGLLPALGLSLPRETHGSTVWLWLYLSNWTQTTGLGGDQLPHFWSLAVEEQFYLLWPVLLWRRSPRQALVIACGVLLLTPFARAWMLTQQMDPGTVYVSTLGRMDALAAGAALAAFMAQTGAGIQVLNLRAWLGVCLLGAVLAVLGSHGFQRLSPAGQVLGYSLLAAVFTAAVAAAASADVRAASGAGALLWHRALRSAPLRVLGRYSYAIYVFHKPLDEWLGQRVLLAWQGRVDTPQLGVAVAYLLVMGALSVLAGALSWHCFEQHFLRLKGRFSAATQAPARHQLPVPVPVR
jgi:peptidoglycan/LPS O-acetylase OafA/YrhL